MNNVQVSEVDLSTLREETEDENTFEEELKDEGTLPIRPWDPKHIRITTKSFSVREVFTQIEERELDLAPDFQRSFVWKPRQQIRLIESLLLGIPLPAFYFNQDISGGHQVIDGVQRLTTIKLFMSDSLPMDENYLEYLSSLSGQYYSTLDSAVKRRFAGTQLVVHIIEPQTPDEVKYDIFNRVNTGGSPLTAQEIRHCMSKSRSRDFLAQLIQTEAFDNATNHSFWKKNSDGTLVRDDQRMANREMALRFCAFKEVSVEEYAQATSLDAFLLEFTRRLDDPKATPDEKLTELKTSFSSAMENAAAVLANGAFRRWSLAATRRGPLNRAVFEAQAIALSNFPTSVLVKKKESVATALRSLFSDPAYDSAVRSGTGDFRKLKLRLEATQEAIQRAIR